MGSSHRFKAGKRATTSHYTQVKPSKAMRREENRRRLEGLRQAQADRTARIEERRERDLGRLVYRLLGISPQQR